MYLPGDPECEELSAHLGRIRLGVGEVGVPGITSHTPPWGGGGPPLIWLGHSSSLRWGLERRPGGGLVWVGGSMQTLCTPQHVQSCHHPARQR